jgi:sarcosine oxidase, subunit alpha
MSEAPFRLPGHTGARLKFSFNGVALEGRAGDTLAAALLANGVHMVARSFKYHRPRGILGAGAEDPNSLLTIGSGAHAYVDTATCVELVADLEARSLNVWPSLRWDVGAVLGRLSRFLPAGFYYKTFFWPHWRIFEGPIRRAAGLGVVPAGADPDRYVRLHHHCDVLIVGSGPSGLAAALAAAQAGLAVLLAEQDWQFGGSLLWEEHAIDGTDSRAWLLQTLEQLRQCANVTLLSRTCVTSYLDHNLLLAVEQAPGGTSPWRQRLWQVRARRVVLATGAAERPLVFPDNDRPGILLASAVRQYVTRHRVAAGRRIALATNNDDAYRTARIALAAGLTVVAVFDTRAGSTPELPGVPVHRGAVIVATRGRHRVCAVTARTFDGQKTWSVECDTVAMSGGWNPAVQLFSQSGGKLRFEAAAAAFVPADARQATHIAGAAAGAGSLLQCLRSGYAAGAAVVGELGLPAPPLREWHADDLDDHVKAQWRVPTSIAGSAKQWVDFHNDVTDQDIELAAQENFQSVEHLKRYTTLGMAPDQGKTSNVNGLAILGELTGREPGQVGTTTFRPPYAPLSFGVIAGRDRGGLFRPTRRLPTHRQQQECGADLQDYGSWTRPACYPRAGEDMAAAIAREVHAVRHAVGILDYSPLGKLEVAGADALAFLNRIVASDLETLKVGRARYSLTLSEDGVISDDGVITRLAEDLLVMGTTSGAASHIRAVMDEWHQRECPDLQVWITDVTTQWAVLMLTGPLARGVLERTDIDIDLAPQAFPHMTLREATIGGVPTRIARVSFTGEVSFEVSVPAGFAPDLWRHFMRSSEDLGLTPVGIEALDVLRLEKGFIHVGGDTDGTTTPEDVGYGGMVRNKPSDFIGRRSLALGSKGRPAPLQLIGLRPLDDPRPLAVGAQLFSASGPRRSGSGHVTSSAWSPTLGEPLALALLASGRSRIGERLLAWHQSAARPVEVFEPKRYDPEGVLLNG